MMENSPNSAVEDELYSMLCRVIDKRKRYPALLCELEEERIANEVKRFDIAKVELEDDKHATEISFINKFIKQQIPQIPTESLTADSEIRLIQAQRNKEKILEFLKIR